MRVATRCGPLVHGTSPVDSDATAGAILGVTSAYVAGNRQAACMECA
jgi:hypothetical protein